ncbi:UDP-glucose--glucosyl LPS alpha1,2-glucosyltransferase [Pectobacterium parmentieri]|uniref:UDP-glucose:glucosyl LPS a1,2-glucosyltransferase n=1 Tax=Pectobacterium parmentieri TaxID=1905730 RepID=A0A0H3I789_PECPM|nr:UDP-glucose--glucosyl LPS alpha1,2-glucosyltransferase [Pectobacterium parmentieri]ACX88770.1 glycosyltransferase family 52 [Pectobacterium parmentieri WPP163]AFI91096.1 UDP-glucose:glucosyl LPS a1,2-glucosyltransferase [Pectobacterium parmentieri]MCL6355542.1 UDP-glucose--glucosyl LPS alpha1,2-glucosyltransferase [Pectobacterium parmentieri]MCL6380567.1 UDP-glucose--glucosyl LPS alpha1,2-glucosyltransferase [Pectobacterium parmentieri]RKO80752.1 UDP-glucose--glucosyl LPS alpha1,2-glucosylt
MEGIDNVFVCITPLQMMIAENIIKKEKLSPKNNILIILYYEKNEKQKYYYKKIRSLFYNSFEFNINFNGSRLMQIKHHYLVNKLISNHLNSFKGYDIYFASINDKTIQQICSKVKINNLLTFDDGTANISKRSIYYENGETLKARALNFIFFIKMNQNKIKKNIRYHYTIYPELANIVDNTKLIELDIWHAIPDQCMHLDGREVRKIFLGQPFEELELDKKNIIETINELGIKYYFPHPREKYKYKDIIYIDSPLIFEDYIYHEIEKGHNVFYEIYSVNSTVMMNISSLSHTNRVRFYYLYNDNLKKRFHDIYNVFDDLDISAIKLSS